MTTLRNVAIFCLLSLVASKGSKPHIKCTPEMMSVEVPMDDNRKMAYLERLKEYTPCAPKLDKGLATFDLDLEDPHTCGVTRVLNKITGKKIFYHKIVVETDEGSETISARCVVTPARAALSQKVKRAADLPAGFQEPEYINITMSLTNTTAIPQLGVAVKQSGKVVSGEISVNPGTPLSMEIFLDNQSAPIYGLLVSYMQVTDTKHQQETIVFNGCSVDPYLFDNFLTEDGDVLAAKFRAFKFPDTTYVQFKGTVTVCLDKCQGVICSNGVTAYGRKRRAIDITGADPNKIFEVSLTTFIKVEQTNGDTEAEEVTKLLRNLKVANHMLEEQSKSVYKTLRVLEGDETHAATVQEKPDYNEAWTQAVESGATRYNARTAKFLAAILVLAILAPKY